MIATAELAGLEHLWEGSLGALFDVYRPVSGTDELALSAALVELALNEQRLGRGAADPPALLVADLCLARASRILSESASGATQIAFARAVEATAVAGAAGQVEPVRERLLGILREAL